MDHSQVYRSVNERLKWIQAIIKRRKWDIIQELKIEAPATIDEVEKIEDELDIKLPADLKILFTEFSKNVEFAYQLDKEADEPFNEIFSGEIYWNLNRFKEQYENYLEWVDSWLDPSILDETELEQEKKIVTNKVPLLEVPNGDLIVVGYNPSEVVYLSHDGDDMHGKILGDSLFEFLEFHSRIGFVGSESWQFEPFYDLEKEKMIMTGEAVNEWVKWLEQK